MGRSGMPLPRDVRQDADFASGTRPTGPCAGGLCRSTPSLHRAAQGNTADSFPIAWLTTLPVPHPLGLVGLWRGSLSRQIDIVLGVAECEVGPRRGLGGTQVHFRQPGVKKQSGRGNLRRNGFLGASLGP